MHVIYEYTSLKQETLIFLLFLRLLAFLHDFYFSLSVHCLTENLFKEIVSHQLQFSFWHFPLLYLRTHSSSSWILFSFCICWLSVPLLPQLTNLNIPIYFYLLVKTALFHFKIKILERNLNFQKFSQFLKNLKSSMILQFEIWKLQSFLPLPFSFSLLHMMGAIRLKLGLLSSVSVDTREETLCLLGGPSSAPHNLLSRLSHCIFL